MNNQGNRSHSSAFVAVAALFTTALVTANIVAVKLVEIGGLVLPAAVVVFPISYILGDVLTEVYGYAQARRVIWLGFACNVAAVIAIVISGALPPAPFWAENQSAFDRILGVTPRILAASFAAYLVGEFANAAVLARMKVATEGRWLFSRTIGSTVIGQGLDSLIFMTAAFWGIIPGEALATAVITQWLVKSAYETLATPLTYLVVGWLKRVEGIDTYDRETPLNPFAFAE